MGEALCAALERPTEGAMKRATQGRRIRIYVAESDQWHGRTLYASIVQEARKQGLAGATVARGVMGYGAGAAIHEPRLFHLTNDLPVVIEIIDVEEKIAAFLPILDAMVQEGLVTTSDVEVLRYDKK
jgi:PII-like signaling protein